MPQESSVSPFRALRAASPTDRKTERRRDWIAARVTPRKHMPTGYYSCVADDTSGHQAEQAFERFEIARTAVAFALLISVS